jgi:hypothetical protein
MDVFDTSLMTQELTSPEARPKTHEGICFEIWPDLLAAFIDWTIFEN